MKIVATLLISTFAFAFGIVVGGNAQLQRDKAAVQGASASFTVHGKLGRVAPFLCQD